MRLVEIYAKMPRRRAFTQTFEFAYRLVREPVSFGQLERQRVFFPEPILLECGSPSDIAQHMVVFVMRDIFVIAEIEGAVVGADVPLADVARIVSRPL